MACGKEAKQKERGRRGLTRLSTTVASGRKKNLCGQTVVKPLSLLVLQAHVQDFAGYLDCFVCCEPLNTAGWHYKIALLLPPAADSVQQLLLKHEPYLKKLIE